MLPSECAHPDLLALDGGPVDPLEPGMLHDILGAVSQVPQALRQVRRQEATDQVLCDRVDVCGNREFALQDLFIDLERVVGKEGRVAREKLEEENSEGPPVGGGAVTGRRDYFGGEVFRRAAKSERSVLNVLGLRQKADVSAE